MTFIESLEHQLKCYNIHLKAMDYCLSYIAILDFYDQFSFSLWSALPQSFLTVVKSILSSPLLGVYWTLPASTLCGDPSVFLHIPPLDILSSIVNRQKDL